MRVAKERIMLIPSCLWGYKYIMCSQIRCQQTQHMNQ